MQPTPMAQPGLSGPRPMALPAMPMRAQGAPVAPASLPVQANGVTGMNAPQPLKAPSSMPGLPPSGVGAQLQPAAGSMGSSVPSSSASGQSGRPAIGQPAMGGMPAVRPPAPGTAGGVAGVRAPFPVAGAPQSGISHAPSLSAPAAVAAAGQGGQPQAAMHPQVAPAAMPHAPAPAVSTARPTLPTTISASSMFGGSAGPGSSGGATVAGAGQGGAMAQGPRPGLPTAMPAAGASGQLGQPVPSMLAKPAPVTAPMSMPGATPGGSMPSPMPSMNTPASTPVVGLPQQQGAVQGAQGVRPGLGPSPVGGPVGAARPVAPSTAGPAMTAQPAALGQAQKPGAPITMPAGLGVGAAAGAGAVPVSSVAAAPRPVLSAAAAPGGQAQAGMAPAAGAGPRPLQAPVTGAPLGGALAPAPAPGPLGGPVPGSLGLRPAPMPGMAAAPGPLGQGPAAIQGPAARLPQSGLAGPQALTQAPSLPQAASGPVQTPSGLPSSAPAQARPGPGSMPGQMPGQAGGAWPQGSMPGQGPASAAPGPMPSSRPPAMPLGQPAGPGGPLAMGGPPTMPGAGAGAPTGAWPAGPPMSMGGPPQGLQQAQMPHAGGPPQGLGMPQPMQPSGPPTMAGPMAGGPTMALRPQAQLGQAGPPQPLGPPTLPGYGAQQQHVPQPQQQAGGPPMMSGGPPLAGGRPGQAGPPMMPMQGYGAQQQQQLQQPQQMQQGPPMYPGQQGMPGQPGGYPQAYPQPPAAAAPAAAAPSQQRPANTSRIDPTNIPRPRYSHPMKPIKYGTSDASVNVPPHAWSDYIAEDQGNAIPRAMRATLGYVPTTKDILKETKLPLAVAVTPLAQARTWAGEAPIQCVDFGAEGPVRCSRCRGYINSHARWTDGGRSWTCPLCGENNEAPGWYQAPLDQYGLRVDRAQRPELSCGSVEFVAPSSYLRDDENGQKRIPMPLCVAFLIDVSLPAVASGLLGASLYAVSCALEAMETAGEGRARAGIIAYDGALHYYDLSPNRKEPAEVLAGDVDDAFCPLALDQWCPTVAGNRARMQSLLERLPSMFPATIARHVQSAGASAIKSAIDGLAHSGGRVVAFLSQMTQIGEGRLTVRELPKHYGIDKEKEMLVPPSGQASTWYADLTRHAAGHGVSVDLLVCTSNSVDLGTISQLAFTTGGEVRVYHSFAPPLGVTPPATGQPMALPDVPQETLQKLAQELSSSLSRDIGTEAVLKVRASKGLSVSRYMGNFSERAESEADLAGLDSDKTLVVTLQHDGNEIREGEGLYLQAALLYTTAGGSLRVRVHTLRLTASESIHDVFRHTDIDAVMAYLVRKSVQTVLTKDARFVAPDLTEAAIEMLYSYRKHCAAHSSPGQLILPESLKLLPLYLSVVTKLVAFLVNRPPPKAVAGRNPFGEVTVRADARLAELIYLSAQPLSSIVPHMYTRMYRVDNLAPGHGIVLGEGEDPDQPTTQPASHYSLTFQQLQRVLLPANVYPSIEQVHVHGIYLVEHESWLALYVGPEADERAVADLFGQAGNPPHYLPAGTQLPCLDTDLSRQVWSIIAAIRSRRAPYLPLVVVSDGDPAGKELLSTLMVEDKVHGVRSYVDLLCHVHTSIQSRMAQA